MGSKIEYVESSHMYATNYIRNSKAIGVLWGIFTICYAIIGVVAFVTPEWLGDLEHENPGRFGLWTRCSYGGNGTLYIATLIFIQEGKQESQNMSNVILIDYQIYVIFLSRFNQYIILIFLSKFFAMEFTLKSKNQS